MDNLDEFLKGSEEPVVEEAPETPEAPIAQEETPAEVVEEPKGQPRDEQGRFAPKGEKQPEEPEPSVSPTPEEPKLDHAALIGERRRRQEAEQRLEQLQAQLQQQQPTQPAPGAHPVFGAPPDRWENPEGYDQWLVNVAAAAAEERATHAVQTNRIYTSAVAARAKYADYAEAHAVFGDMVQSNPALFQQMVNAPDPAEFCYQTAKTEMEIRQYGGIDKLVEARVQAQLAAKQPTPTIPDTLADAQSARGNSAEPFTPPSLDEILGRR